MVAQISPRLLRSEPFRRCCLEECHAACCNNGTWVDLLEVEDILQHSALILPHLSIDCQDPGMWFDQHQEADPHSLSGLVLHTAIFSDSQPHRRTTCVFLRNDDKCALQISAEIAGLHLWRFKPFYCILHPLDFDEEGRITLEENSILLEEPASCLRPSDTPILLLLTFKPELEYLLGERLYSRILKNRES